MIDRSKLALVGAFVLGGVLLFAVGIFMIGDRRLLFSDSFDVAADFGNVTGVQVGTRVRVTGFDAGEVTDILIPPSPSTRFRVVMRVTEEVHPLVRADSVAAILTDGLIGSAYIQIREGTEAAPPIEPGDAIEGVEPVDIADLIEEGRATFRTVANEVLDLKEQLSGTVSTFDETLHTTNLLITDVGNDVRTISSVSALFMDDARGIASTVRSITDGVQAGRGTLGQLVTNDELYDRVTSIATSADETMRSVRATAEHVQESFTNLTDPEGPNQRILADVRDTLSYTRDAMSDLAENAEALKHNWLFRGFFRDRGFFNLDSMSLEEYRRLDAGDQYTPLRIWLDAGVLFEPTGEGEPQLTEDGRRRLNSAMAQLLQYPRDSPLVIEGYSTAATPDQQYLESLVRARLVRDYLVTRFSRSGNLTGAMPIGAEATGSPGGTGQWNGIAITMFVRPESFRTIETALTMP